MNLPGLPSFEEYKLNHLAKGCTEVVVRDWAPNLVIEEHSHPFTADALLVKGEMWLTVGEQIQHLRVGQTFHLKANTPHHEKYGSLGATYWVARTSPSLVKSE